ncbi:EcsC family protein [Phenylobacterium sp.]|uniref:EcsC family protein n=1 Tax=Phenylobacterium sp. TaxID=1871053 RepID=UPI0027369F76|nr:EcsC family protein [Phenylobacterium sp.]MDP3855814.1 EcsC family protein [Phenylobacterium sp.]
MSEAYEVRARAELAVWKRRILKKPGLLGDAARAVQGRINRAIPEKVHAVITEVIEQMTRGIMTGSDLTTPQPLIGAGLEEREARVREKIALYRTTAAAEGGVAGAGGFLLAAVDFPALIGLKIKLLFDIAALYGHSGDLAAERLYILQIFQLAFSSPGHRHEIYDAMTRTGSTPVSLEDFDWRKFQQEYRDHIDLAKLAQLIPVIGAPVGAIVNFHLVDKLGETAMNAYRLRIFS